MQLANSNKASIKSPTLPVWVENTVISSYKCQTLQADRNVASSQEIRSYRHDWLIEHANVKTNNFVYTILKTPTSNKRQS